MSDLLTQLDLLAEKATARPWSQSALYPVDDGKDDRRMVVGAGSIVVAQFHNAMTGDRNANADLTVALVNHWPEIRRVIEAAREADEVISAYVLDRRERDALRMQDVSPKLHAALRELTRDAALEDEPER